MDDRHNNLAAIEPDLMESISPTAWWKNLGTSFQQKLIDVWKVKSTLVPTEKMPSGFLKLWKIVKRHNKVFFTTKINAFFKSPAETWLNGAKFDTIHNGESFEMWPD